MKSISELDRAVARAAASAFGGKPRVTRFYDADESHSVDLLISSDRPSPGFTSHSTVDLHNVPNPLEGTDMRVEIAGVAPSAATAFANMLATAAFYVIKDGWLCAPGVVFPSLMKEYGLSSTLSHVMWNEPFPWEQLESAKFSEQFSVHWLLAVPISDAEYELLLDRGFFALQLLFTEHEIEYFDLDRRSVV